MNRYIAFDLETTGLSREDDLIIEIGMVKVQDGEIIERFQSFVNPGVPLRDEISVLTGITDEMLKDAPSIFDLLDRVSDFVKGEVLVGHNVEFDAGFLSKYIPIENTLLDTLKLSRILLPFTPDHKLGTVARYLGIEVPVEHRALDDAITTYHILEKLKELIPETDYRVLIGTRDILPEGGEKQFLANLVNLSVKKGLNAKGYPFPIPENVKIPAMEETVRIDVEKALSSEILERREQQVELAKRVEEAFEREEFLIAEAPTGIGKSLAYLLPSMKFSKENQEKIYISTFTKTLQEQLLNKDIPLAEKLTGLGVKVVLQKGKNNYLCLKKLVNMRGDEKPEVYAGLFFWSKITKTGDLSEVFQILKNTDIIYYQVDDTCTGSECPFYRDCFYFRMKRELADANIVLSNHALIFREGIETPYIVFDEAHELERVATDALSRTFRYSHLRYLQRVMKPLLTRKKYRELEDKMKDMEKVYQEVVDTLMPALEKFNTTPYDENNVNRLIKISDFLEGISEFTDDENVMAIVDRLKSDLSLIIHMDDPAYAFYARWLSRNDPLSVEFVAAPVDVSEKLSEFFRGVNTAVFTSATLTIAHSFGFFKDRMGLRGFREKTITVKIPEVYDYVNQLKIIIPLFLPYPDRPDFPKKAAELIMGLTHLRKGSLILFTSYQQMEMVHSLVSDHMEVAGITLLKQSRMTSRSALIEKFKEDIESVLMGTSTFWQGIDIPGEALEILIMAKLPFPNMNDPVLRARSKRIEMEGESSFERLSLPLAVLKFRQGIGRVIRSKEDRGVIIILDRRMLEKDYGTMFIESLPVDIIPATSFTELITEIEKFFNV